MQHLIKYRSLDQKLENEIKLIENRKRFFYELIYFIEHNEQQLEQDRFLIHKLTNAQGKYVIILKHINTNEEIIGFIPILSIDCVNKNIMCTFDLEIDNIYNTYENKLKELLVLYALSHR